MRRGELLQELSSGGLRGRLSQVYGAGAAEAAVRLRELVLEYAGTFPCDESADTWLFSTPGRTELGGNHTDHQRGAALAGSVNLDTIACVVPNRSRTIRIKSRHHRIAEVNLDDLSIHPAETGSSPSLVRGVAARLTRLGYAVGGFDAYTTTRVLRGSGLSSSAAFEVLVCTIMSHLFCDASLSPVQLAQVGQYAENVYFGKPCGLLDQLSCAAGGVISADFRDPGAPAVRKVQVDLAAHGYALCIVDSRASHADLTDDYAAIPREMGEVALCLGCQALGEADPRQFWEQLPHLRAVCGDRAVLRAIHIYDENRRVEGQVDALRRGDFDAFLALIRESGLSSWRYLQNVVPAGYTHHQEVALALSVCERLLDGRGACRVHGGGFAGTIQAFVPLDMLDGFRAEMDRVLGDGACHVLTIRPVGGVRLV